MKKTLFKLPLLFVLFYWLVNIVLFTAYFIVINNYFTASDLTFFQISKGIIQRLSVNFYLQLPNSIILFIVAIVLLNKYSINIINRKNIINTFIIAILIVLSEIVGRWFYRTYINKWVFIDQQYAGIEIYFISIIDIFNCTKVVMSYLFITILTFFSVKFLNYKYIHNDSGLTQIESQKLHLGVFISLYNCYFITVFISFFMLDRYIDYSSYSIIIELGILIIFLLITNLLGYFLLRRCFKGVTESLNLTRLIISSLSTFILNCILLVFIIFICIRMFEFLQIYYSLPNTPTLITCCWVIIVMLFIVSSLMVRTMAKLFFDSKKEN